MVLNAGCIILSANHSFYDTFRTTLLNARRISRENSGQHVILLAMEDITERKRAEEALKETARVKSEFLEKLNQAQQVAKIGSWDGTCEAATFGVGGDLRDFGHAAESLEFRGLW